MKHRHQAGQHLVASGRKLLAAKLLRDLEVSRDFDIIAGSYTVAVLLTAHQLG